MILRIAIVSVLGLGLLTPSAQAVTTFDTYTGSIERRVSRHFDRFGFTYAAPSYGVTNQSSPSGSPRDRMLMSMFYRPRVKSGDAVATGLVRDQLKAALAELQTVGDGQESFGFSQGAFVAYRWLEDFPDLLPENERTTAFRVISRALPHILHGTDNANRWLIIAAHGQYLVDRLQAAGYYADRPAAYLSDLIARRTRTVVQKSISPDGWYREGKKFTAHYQAVSAFMLASYASQQNDQAYLALSKTMYRNLKALAFRNGLVEARIGYRPVGHGAQFYLMMGTLAALHGDRDYHVFYNYSRRFFSDRSHPDRLVYHSTLEGSSRVLHDDIAFTDAVEISRLFKPVAALSINSSRIYFRQPVRQQADQDFRILNDGTILSVTDRKRNIASRWQLGSYGNWSRRLAP